MTLKPRSAWRASLKDKHALISEIEQELAWFPGISFNFSQAIQDNVQEAMSGVKGENAVKLYGPDLRQLEALAMEIQRHMEKVRGVKDLGVLHLLGQPNLIIEVELESRRRERRDTGGDRRTIRDPGL